MADTKNGPLCTPFDTPIVGAVGLEGEGIAARGGFDLGEGSQPETANMSGLPTLPTLVTIDGAPARGEQVEPAKGVTSPGIPITTFGEK